jgi:hypothetical protein
MFMTLFSLGFLESSFFGGGKQLILFFCVQPHQLSLLEHSVQEREILGVFCVWQHLLLLLELSDQKREICNVCDK